MKRDKKRDFKRPAGENEAKKSNTKSGGKFSTQGRPQVRTGSTTQGGSDFGQGSMHLGSHANRQGAEKNEGSNYDNEDNFDI